MIKLKKYTLATFRNTTINLEYNDNYFDNASQAFSSIFDMMSMILGDVDNFMPDTLIAAFDEAAESDYASGFQYSGSNLFQYDEDMFSVYQIMDRDGNGVSYNTAQEGLVCYLVLHTGDLKVYFTSAYTFTERNGIKTLYYFD